MEKISGNMLRTITESLFFDGFREEEAVEIINALNGELLDFAEGETIVENTGTEPFRHMLLILSGMVQLIRYGVHGERFLIDYSFAGAVVGYVGSITSRFLFNSSFAAGRDCVILQLDLPEKMTGNVRYREILERNLLKIASNKYARLLQKADITTRRLVKDKIFTFLSYESQQCGSSSFDIALNRQELADYLCVDRTTLSTELTRMQNEGLILKKKEHFELLKKPFLWG